MIFILQMEGDLKMFDINELKKDLYRSKNLAKFSHYQSGELFYTVEIAQGKYQFPIATVETSEHSVLFLSEDLGITPFDAEVRGSELIRWIQKAIKNETFIKVG